MVDPKVTKGRVKILRRYSDLPALIDILAARRLTLLNPKSWDDRNDSHFIERYKSLSQKETVLALCLSQVSETYHHWRVFCGHPAGVCIELDRKSLLSQVKSVEGLKGKAVIYKTLDEIKREPLTLAELPFLKRKGYKDEVEYRLIYENERDALDTFELPLDINTIRRVVLSPWLAEGLIERTRELLSSIPGCGSLEIAHSKLRGNRTWMRQADRLIDAKPNLQSDAKAKESTKPKSLGAGREPQRTRRG